MRMWKPTRRTLVVATSLAGVISIIATVLLTVPPARSPFKTVRSKANFSLYYPTKLPEGFTLATRSVSWQDNTAVIFWLSNANGDKIYFSEVAKPANFDFEKFKSTLTTVRVSKVGIGTATIGKTANGQTTIVSIPTATTWLLMNTTYPLSASAVDSILKNMRLDN